VIFGAGDMADLAHYYFTHDSTYDVVAFTVDADHLIESEYLGVPVVEFDKVTEHFSPSEHDLFVALSYSELNQVRKDRYLKGKHFGYNMASYVSSYATVLNDQRIGDNCFILEDNTIQPFVSIGDNVTLWSGNHIGHHSRIGNHTFIASHVVVSGGVEIGEQCFIGVNATLRDHISVGDKVVLGAGALILKDVVDDALIVGTASRDTGRTTTGLKRI
jgi:sugar O-acyltransferase (sialic acid O-acetyltransferase NeuD family)